VTGGHIDGTIKAERRPRTRRGRGVGVFVTALVGVLAAVFAAVRYFTADEAGPSLACRARLYSPYDPRNLEQCMVVCMICTAEVKRMCSTSCMLTGAR
jgi:hypothetical protein